MVRSFLYGELVVEWIYRFGVFRGTPEPGKPGVATSKNRNRKVKVTGLRREEKRIARNTIVQAILDYAHATRKLKDPRASQRTKTNAARVCQEVSEFFSDGHTNIWLLQSGFDINFIEGLFKKLVADENQLSNVAKLRYAG